MISTIPPWLAVGVLIGSALVTGAMGGYAYRNRDKPGAGWLAVTLLGTTVWTGSYAMGLVTHDPSWRPFWEHFQWFGTAVLPVSFVLFAFAYTGYDRFVTRRRIAGLFFIPVVTIVLVWTDEFHQLMWIENRVVIQDGLATMVATQGPWFWLTLAYSYLLVLVGGALLIRLLFVSDYLYAEQSILFSLGIILPLLGNAVAVFVETSPPGFDLTPYGFAIWGITLYALVYRGELFSLLPATRRLGQNAAIAQLEQGIVISDTDHRLIYANPAAEEMLDIERAKAIGDRVTVILGVDSPAISEAVTELHRESRRYELRNSPITDRRDRTIGYTITLYDVTARHRREQRLERQQRELERIEELNAAIRGVNQALLSSTDREAIDATVCDVLHERTRYEAVCLADSQTALGLADEWTSRGTEATPPAIPDLGPTSATEPSPTVSTGEPDTREQSWATVPIVYRNVLYGVLCVTAGEERLSSREQTILAELCELVGHAIEALEHRQLVSADSLVEVTIESTDERSPLVTVTARTGAHLELNGLIPKDSQESVAFLHVDGAPVDAVHEELSTLVSEPVWIVRGDESAEDSVVALTVSADSVLGLLAAATTKLSSLVVEDETAIYELEAASEQVIRRVFEQVQQSFPETRLRSKKQRDGPLQIATHTEDDGIGMELTDRQQEVLEAAFRMGYFDWPREATAEEVADAMDLAPATIHGHLRKGEQSIFSTLFQDAVDGTG